ncbi:MAG: amidohydrolase [Firmicutes bacterium]|jgi:imidazolonepropionase-like amidohydrolase|nr:amidohydrolase [Bacillota bacterium]MCL5065583.1 amidohydrolase [Bacillota bacterium]
MLAIVGGRVETISHGPIVNGTVLVNDQGMISAVGSEVTVPSGTRVIDAHGQYVLPGFIDTHTHLGVHVDGQGWEGSDVNEMTSPTTPGVRALDGFHRDDPALKDALAGGITTAWVTPGSGNVIGGQGATIRLFGRSMADMVLKAPSGMKSAMGENPKRVYGKDGKFPQTRLGIAKALRQALVDADNYRNRRAREAMADRNLDHEALALVLDRQIPLRTHAHLADDIRTALAIGREFSLRQVIEHGTEADRVIDLLLEYGVAVSWGPALVSRVKVEVAARSFRVAGILSRAGVKVSIITDHPVVPIPYLVVSAALAVREGMEEAKALSAITLTAAEINGVADRVGSIEVGKDADLVIWTGHPFEIRSVVDKTLVKGVVVYDRNEDEDRP